MGIGLIGVLSDTHGIVRPEIQKAFQGCELIIHAGDVGKPEVLKILKDIAPTVAVRGNIDKGDWAEELPANEVVRYNNKYIYVLHDLSKLDIDPGASGFDVVVSGHSHIPSEESKGGVLYLNPGSAGPRRFKLPISFALLEVSQGQIKVQQMKLPSD